MSQALVMDLARNAIMLALMLAGPLLGVAVTVGLFVSVLQAVTQVQEQTISFAAKLVSIVGVFLLLLPWLLQTAMRYTIELFTSFPSLVS
jgi:flagellar biosynthesis protein FliQ